MWALVDAWDGVVQLFMAGSLLRPWFNFDFGNDDTPRKKNESAHEKGSRDRESCTSTLNEQFESEPAEIVRRAHQVGC